MATANGITNPIVPEMGTQARANTTSGSSGFSSIISALSSQPGLFRQFQQERLNELAPNRAIREDYSKAAAFEDAQGLMNQQLQKALEESLGSLTRASEGAGTSQSALRALLTQKAAENAAMNAAAAGAELAVQYGGVANNTSSILEALTRADDGGLRALLTALQGKQQAQVVQSGGRNDGPQIVNKAPAQVGLKKNTSGAPTMVLGPVGGSGGGSSGSSAASFFNRPGNAGEKGVAFYGGPTISPDQYANQLARLVTTTPVFSQEAMRGAAGDSFTSFYG